jgi:AcrR family transcriptional regulator
LEPLTETQRRLIDAALDVFAERGFEGATTAQIAARAGVAEKTLFANFGNKQRLYRLTLEPATILATMLPEAIRTLTPVLASPPDDVRALLRALFRNRIAFASGHRRQIKLLAQHLVLRPEGVLALTGAFGDRISPVALPLLERLVARGAVRSDVPLGTMMRIIVTSLVGYVLTRTLFRPDLEWDDEREIEDLIRVLAEGLVPRAP